MKITQKDNHESYKYQKYFIQGPQYSSPPCVLHLPEVVSLQVPRVNVQMALTKPNESDNQEQTKPSRGHRGFTRQAEAVQGSTEPVSVPNNVEI